MTPATVQKTVTLTNTGYSSFTITLSTTTSTTLPAVASYTTQDVIPATVTNTISTTATLPESIILDTLAPISITVTHNSVVVTTSVVKIVQLVFPSVNSSRIVTYVDQNTDENRGDICQAPGRSNCLCILRRFRCLSGMQLFGTYSYSYSHFQSYKYASTSRYVLFLAF